MDHRLQLSILNHTDLHHHIQTLYPQDSAWPPDTKWQLDLMLLPAAPNRNDLNLRVHPIWPFFLHNPIAHGDDPFISDFLKCLYEGGMCIMGVKWNN